MDLRSAPTPAFVLDRARLAANASAMLERCAARGVRLRPHMKTLKCLEAARLVIDPQHGGIAVSTLNEAAFFAAGGFDDIQLAVCLSQDKLARATDIARRAGRFSFFVDSLSTAAAVGAVAEAQGVTLRVWIEVDCGEHRTGVAPDSSALLEIAAHLSSAPGVVLEGVATHAGQAYLARTPVEIAAVAEQERAAVVAAAERLRAAGFKVPATSVGSTPTAWHGGSAEGVSEMRAGVYMAGDLFQANIGSLALDAIAGTVLATVISHNRDRNQIVIDAGGLALSKDRSTAATADADFAYGLVLDVAGRNSFGPLVVADVHQEHGEIRAAAPLPFAALPIGARVRIAPNHVCMTAAMYGDYLVVEGEETQVLERWSRTNGW